MIIASNGQFLSYNKEDNCLKILFKLHCSANKVIYHKDLSLFIVAKGYCWAKGVEGMIDFVEKKQITNLEIIKV